MKKFLTSLLLLTFIATISNAQLLWKISGNGLEKPSYLFGTHHIAPISMLDSVAGFNEAFKAADKVYGEMVMSESKTPQAQQAMLAYVMAPQDSTLTAVLTPAQIDSVNTMLQKYMGPMASVNQFDVLKPSMVCTVVALAQSQRAFPSFNPEQQLDTEIQTRAAAAGKEVGGLETLDDQCKALFGSPIIEQAKELMDLVRNDNKSLEMAHTLANAYMAGDLNKMLEIIEDPTMGAGENAEKLINKRNANWVGVMAGLLPTASILIAVGAGHLPGEKGLISLLRNEGYTVEPVK